MEEEKIEREIKHKLFAKKLAKQLNVQRFLLIGETKAPACQGKAMIMCWNGKEFQNQIDLVGLYALGARAIFLDDNKNDTRKT